jgi:predicted metalloendopeptidase
VTRRLTTLGTALVVALAVLAPAGCSGVARPMGSGIRAADVNRDVRPQDGLFEFANGEWLRATEVPEGRVEVGPTADVAAHVEEQEHALLEDAAAPRTDAQPAFSDLTRKVGDVYASFMDTARVDRQRATPMDIDFAAVDKLVNAADLTNYLGILRSIDVPTPIALDVEPDRGDTAVTVAVAHQDGLTLPSRDLYLASDQQGQQVRTALREYVTTMFTLAGTPAPQEAAATVLDLETRLAALQWSGAQNADVNATYNKFPVTDAQARTGIGWDSYLGAADADAHELVVAQPSYFAGLGALLTTVPLPAWKTYLRWRLLDSSAPYLSSDFVDTRTAFAARVPGVPHGYGPRWRRAVAAVNAAMGDGLGQLYAERYVPDAVTDRVQRITDAVVATYRRAIGKLDWMSPPARSEAQAKLTRMQVAIGIPHEFKDWSLLTTARDDLLGNVRRAASVRVGRLLDSIGNRSDDRDWDTTTAQATAVRYDRIRNALIVPAGALQPPFFDVDAEDAVNYGSIGTVIAHEISHAFDDRGRWYDAAGAVRDWWTPADAIAYAAKADVLAARADGVGMPPGYAPKLAAYPQAPMGADSQAVEQPPIPDEHTTVSEAVADLSGLAMAASAYRTSLGRSSSPEIDGFTGPQRLFLGYARLWRVKPRDQAGYVDPNDPGRFRTDAVVNNLDAFYDAWDVKPGDLAYLPPAQRIRFW